LGGIWKEDIKGINKTKLRAKGANLGVRRGGETEKELPFHSEGKEDP